MIFYFTQLAWDYAKQTLQYLLNIVTKSGSNISDNKRHNLQAHKPIL